MEAIRQFVLAYGKFMFDHTHTWMNTTDPFVMAFPSMGLTIAPFIIGVLFLSSGPSGPTIGNVKTRMVTKRQAYIPLFFIVGLVPTIVLCMSMLIYTTQVFVKDVEVSREVYELPDGSHVFLVTHETTRLDYNDPTNEAKQTHSYSISTERDK